MAALPPRLLPSALLGAAVLLAGCTDVPADGTSMADRTERPPSVASPRPVDDGPATPRPPDLSTAVIDCTRIEEPCDYGDDPALDRMWDACAAGDGGACDRLYYDSGFDTRYEQFGNTCGDRGIVMPCPTELDA